jgi:hypothetical protein
VSADGQAQDRDHADTGTGMEPEHISKYFRSIFHAVVPTVLPAPGLALTIVKNFVDRMGRGNYGG